VKAVSKRNVIWRNIGIWQCQLSYVWRSAASWHQP
jgi:hypothetical protein